jgi:molybdopterin synthase sulfur carrier subunit
MPSTAAPVPTGSVTVRYWAAARAAAGVDREELAVGNDPTVGEVLEATLHRHPDLVAVLRVASFLVDGRAARRIDPVSPGSVVEVLPPFAGG